MISFDDVDHFTSVMSTLILTYVHMAYVRNPVYAIIRSVFFGLLFLLVSYQSSLFSKKLKLKTQTLLLRCIMGAGRLNILPRRRPLYIQLCLLFSPASLCPSPLIRTTTLHCSSESSRRLPPITLPRPARGHRPGSALTVTASLAPQIAFIGACLQFFGLK